MNARSRCVAVNGVISAGFQTTVLPCSSAGAIFQAGMAMGKFYGVMALTTPIGPRRQYSSTPGCCDG
jgi:hypothetical protein